MIYEFRNPTDVLRFIRTLPSRRLQYAWYKQIRKDHFNKDCYKLFPETLEQLIEKEDGHERD